ncbi:FG-GAP-like repeat-containing protein [Actinoplanes subglobosus]|uniref:FG-GAP-like repeat-containing protein n=1 Tax=Actinoplanes subglobosus TaxID=1547892 RepID=A0ABV8IR78_9ACTN
MRPNPARQRLGVVGLLALLFSLMVVPQPAIAADVPHLRVMPLGDSITAGAGSSRGRGYREPLWYKVRNQTAFTMDFVGSQREGAVPDPQHEGHRQWKIKDIDGNVESWLTSYSPDVVLLHIGINDLDKGGDPEGASDDLEDLLTKIFTAKPGVTVILAGLLPSAPVAAQAARFNIAAQQIVADRAAAGDRIRYVEFPVTADQMTDRLHPADTGYAVIAETYFTALRQVVAEGGTTTSPAPSGSAPETSSKVRWADFDGDGQDDYWLIADGGAVQVWLNRDNGNWWNQGQVGSGLTSNRRQVRFADFDGDGRDDYLWITSTGAVRVYLNRGGDAGDGWPLVGQVAPGMTANADQVRFADFDGDGKTDYFLISETGVVNVQLNRGGDGHGGWLNLGKVAGGLTTDATRVRLTDYDGDGRVDYVWIDENGAVQAWLNRGGDGRGGWQGLGQVALGATTDHDQVRFAQYTTDTRADYVRVNLNGAVDVWTNGTGGWSGPQRIAGGAVIE